MVEPTKEMSAKESTSSHQAVNSIGLSMAGCMEEIRIMENSEPQTQNAVNGQMKSNPSSTIKFKTRWNEITVVEVERETDQSVWINGRRNAKLTYWEGYFDTFEQAKAHLVSVAEKDVERYKAALHRARTALGNIQSLKPPSVP